MWFAILTPWKTYDLELFLRSSILTKKSGLQKENLRQKKLKRDSNRRTRTSKFLSKDSNHKIWKLKSLKIKKSDLDYELWTQKIK